ncbi:MAG: hypothetical protein ACXVPU_19580 [Bacteroidia bacterium]
MNILKSAGLLLLAIIWIKVFVSVFSEAVNNLRKAKARNIDDHFTYGSESINKNK